MLKLTVLYPHPHDTEAFAAYYAATHAGLVNQIPGLLRFEQAAVTGTPGGTPPAYFFVAELYFESMETFQAGMGGPQGQAAVADVPNFSAQAPTFLICTVLA